MRHSLWPILESKVKTTTQWIKLCKFCQESSLSKANSGTFCMYMSHNKTVGCVMTRQGAKIINKYFLFLVSKNTRVQCTVEGYCTQTSVAVSTVYRYLCFCFLNVLLCLSVMVMNTTDSFHHVWHSWTWLWKYLKTFWSCWTTGTYNWLVETYMQYKFI